MGRHLQPVPHPSGFRLVTAAQIAEATACADCNSDLYFVPMRQHDGSILFGTFTAHDDTCPAMKAATEAAERGNNEQ